MKWTAAHDQLIRELYPTMPAQVLAQILGTTARAVRQRAAFLKVKRSVRPPTNWRPIGTERFDKDKGVMLRKVTDTGNPKKDWKRVEVIEWEALHGPIPPGKVLALKRPGLPRTPENMTLCTSQEQFLLVKMPPLAASLPLGSERMQSDGLRYRKVANTGNKWTDWKRVEVLEWEKLNGPIPEGYVLMIKDMDKPRTMDNLALFTRAQNFERVAVHRLPPELQELYQIKAQISKAVRKLDKVEA